MLPRGRVGEAESRGGQGRGRTAATTIFTYAKRLESGDSRRTERVYAARGVLLLSRSVMSCRGKPCPTGCLRQRGRDPLASGPPAPRREIYGRGRVRARAPVGVSATIASAASWGSSCAMHATRSSVSSGGRRSTTSPTRMTDGAFKVGVLIQHLIEGPACSDESDHRLNGDAKTADAGLPLRACPARR